MRSDANRQTIAEICRRLDGLPLAIELAAARVRLFEPQVLLARLSSWLNLLTTGASDLPLHQRTLRGAIDWSYNLLTPEEQTLFRRLGVFAGGCTLEAAEQVAGEGLNAPVVDLLQSLADKSLVRVETQDGEPRFSLLEMLREYAVERLEHSGESDALRRRHAEYFVAYVERIEPAFSFQERADWIEQLDRERDNIAVAMAEAHNLDDTVLQIRFVSAAHPLLSRLPDSEIPSWLPRLFAKPEARTYPFIYAKAIYHATSFVGFGRSAITTAQRSILLQDAATIFETCGEKVWKAAYLVARGRAAYSVGELALAEQHCASSIRLFEEAGQRGLAADALNWLAAALRNQSKFMQAEQLFNQSRAMFDAMHDEVGKGSAINGLGELEYYRGNYEAANTCYAEAQPAFRGTMWRELTKFGTGRVAYVQGRPLEALALLETCVADARYWSNSYLLSIVLHHLAFVQHLLHNHANALTYFREAFAMQHERAQSWYIAESLERAAWIAADQCRYPRAARLFGAAKVLREAIGAPMPLGDMPLHKPRLRATKSVLDEAMFTALWDEGRAMNLDQAVEYALSESD